MQPIIKEELQPLLQRYEGKDVYIHIETTNGMYASHFNEIGLNAGTFLIAKGQHPDDEGKGGMYYPLRNQPERTVASLMMETEVSTSVVYFAYQSNL